MSQKAYLQISDLSKRLRDAEQEAASKTGRLDAQGEELKRLHVQLASSLQVPKKMSGHAKKAGKDKIPNMK